MLIFIIKINHVNNSKNVHFLKDRVNSESLIVSTKRNLSK